MDVIKLEGIYVEGYGTIAKAVMQDRNLHVTAKAIYSYMSSFAGGSQSCFATRSKIAYDLKISNETLGKYLKELSENGYITIGQSKKKGKFACNIYTILCTKKTVTENSEYETSECGNLDTNNNSINNNNLKNINVQNSENESQKQTAEMNFERFYKIYPKKKKRTRVWSWFRIHNPSDELVDEMIEAVKRQMNTIEWQKDGGRYIPHPYSWLNSGAWENEINQNEMAETSKKSPAFSLSCELYERIFNKSCKDETQLKSWAVVIDEYLAINRNREREDKVFRTICKATADSYWRKIVVDAESLIKNINSIRRSMDFDLEVAQNAEMSLIGGILLDGNALIQTTDILSVDDFYYDELKSVYKSMLRLSNAGKRSIL